MSNISTNNNKHIKHKYIIDINNNIINSDNISNSSDHHIIFLSDPGSASFSGRALTSMAKEQRPAT